jgi:hypothetical protein
MKRTNKEIELLLNESCETFYGTTNKLNPKIIYLTCKTWVEPNDEKDYEQIINKSIIKLKKELFDKISHSNIFDKTFISNFEINTLSLKKNKKNFFNFEIYIKQKNKILPFNDLKSDITNLFQPLINHLFLNLTNNSLVLTKGKH